LHEIWGIATLCTSNASVKFSKVSHSWVLGLAKLAACL